ncbi:MAG: co-chaperone YbbN [Actinobacteria bacterium]|nr:co-chaperone YbbN [Actinomycetota bacterium]
MDVTDATFQTDVLERSMSTPVVVDLWAPWCGPCTTLGPIIERVVAETDGAVLLAKVNVDENPQIAQAFRAQSIPAVHAIIEGKLGPSFLGARPEAEVRAFVQSLLPTREQTEVERLRELGDEASLLHALELEPADEGTICDLAELYAGEGRYAEALGLLERVPESADTRRIAAYARSEGRYATDDSIIDRLGTLLDQVKGDDEARREFLDLLELLGPEDPRTADHRRQLTSRLF